MSDQLHFIRGGQTLNPEVKVPMVECGCCECYHRSDFWGDCRNDSQRFLPHDPIDGRSGVRLRGRRAVDYRYRAGTAHCSPRSNHRPSPSNPARERSSIMIRHEEIVMETLPDPCPDTSYLEQEGFEERLRQADNGLFGFMGIRANAPSSSGSASPVTSSSTASRAPAFGMSKPTPLRSTFRSSSKTSDRSFSPCSMRSAASATAPTVLAELPLLYQALAHPSMPEGLSPCPRASALECILVPEQMDPEPDSFARPTIALDRSTPSEQLPCRQVLPPPEQGSPLSARYG